VQVFVLAIYSVLVSSNIGEGEGVGELMHKLYVRPEISRTHKLTNYKVSSQVFITSRIIIHYNSIKSITKWKN